MRITVRVTPRAKKARIEKSDQGLRVYLTEPAVEGKANKRLIAVLAEYFHVKKYQVSILKGEKQRDKVVEIEDGKDDR